jgi:NADPH:quinone reductase-like Zn-dependent oxidoreductase
MKAIVQEGYGSGAMLHLREIEKPDPGDDGVLVEVRAASVNALDWHLVRGVPVIIPLLERLSREKYHLRGVDVAGRVAAVGKNVSRLVPGDEVFGGADGSFAEYAATAERRLAKKPAAVSFEQAATLPVAGLTALQGLRDRARVQPGQRVVVNGAGGGVGTFALQIAKFLGAHVTAVTRTESVELARSLGADVVVDYQAEDFTRRGERYDVIFDIGGASPFRSLLGVLSAEGIVVAVGGPQGRWIAPADRMLAAMAHRLFSGRRKIRPFVAKTSPEDLASLASLVEQGRLEPVIDRTFSLEETGAAVEHVGRGRARGKVVIRIADASAGRQGAGL